VQLYVCNALGHVRALIDAETGQVTDRYDYDAWGNVVHNGTTRQPFTWNGAYGYEWMPFAWDRASGYGDGWRSEVGLYHVGARAYDPRTARWLQRDPAGAAGGHPNLYRYCHNDPINRADPDGAKPLSKEECDKRLAEIQTALDKAEKELSELVPGDALGGYAYRGGTTKPLGHCEEVANSLNTAKDRWEKFSRGDCWRHYKGDKRPGSLSKRTDQLVRDFESKTINLLSTLKRYVLEGQMTPGEAIQALQRILPHIQRYGQRLLQQIAELIKELSALATRFAKRAGGVGLRKVPGVNAIVFIYDWYSGGIGHAFNELLWPVSALWNRE